MKNFNNTELPEVCLRNRKTLVKKMWFMWLLQAKTWLSYTYVRSISKSIKPNIRYLAMKI